MCCCDIPCPGLLPIQHFGMLPQGHHGDADNSRDVLLRDTETGHPLDRLALLGCRFKQPALPIFDSFQSCRVMGDIGGHV